MARSGGGGANYLSSTTLTNIPSAFPISFAVFLRQVSGTESIGLFLGDSTISNIYFTLAIHSTRGFEYQVRNGGAFDSAGFSVANGGSPGTSWAYMVGVSSSSTSHKLFANGSLIDTDTNATTFPTPNTLGMLRSLDSVPNGDAAEVCEGAIWNVALADDDAIAISKGISPRLVRPNALVRYFPVWGTASPEQELIDGYSLTATGTVTKVDRPRVIYRQRPKMVYIPAKAPAGNRRRRMLIAGTR